MKKTLSLIIGLIVFFSPLLPALANVSGTGGEKKQFLVTAYYSPKPDQRFYIRGSYEADIRLNGRGTNGASGKEVFIGMLAAPKTYPFGTRISLPGLGVGEVFDRGGAIVSRKNYDRIDVWMGPGEEGLARALNWGARLVEGEIFWTPHQVEPGLSYAWVNPQLSEAAVNRLINKTQAYTAPPSSPVTVKSDPVDVTKLQETLTQLGYYEGPINGVYGTETSAAVLGFQLDEGVVESESSQGAGNYGPQTTAKLQKRVTNLNLTAEREQARLDQNRMLLASGLGRNASGEDVTALQRMLWELGYYTEELNGVYDENTIDAVYKFQKDHKLVEFEWDAGAGYYGNRTHAALEAVINEKMTRVYQFPNEYQSWVPAKRTLPKLDALTYTETKVKHIAFLDTPTESKHTFIVSNELDLNDKGQEVVRLQNILIDEGFLASDLNTGYYGAQTKQAVIKYQLSKGLIDSTTSAGAGRVGPNTLSALSA